MVDGSAAIKRLRMLIVDDEQDICDLLEHFFRSRGFTVRSAFSGEEALDLLQADGCPEVILLDINLPGLSGIEVLRRAKEASPDARIVMVSALDRDDLKREAHRYGAVDYVTKPFDFKDTTWAAVLQYYP
ncbi:MAG TPA: response regulator [bacterium]